MTTSIVIVLYNGLHYLPGCLDSVIPEMALGDELILVDNASTDGSADLVQLRWPQVKLVRNLTNQGYASACNQGARQALGEILVFLNQDMRVQPGWLSGLLSPLAEDPAVGLATSKLLLMSRPDQIQMCGQSIHFTGLVFGRGFLQPSAESSDPAVVGAVAGASFAIRRSLWQQLDGFDAGLFMYYEETDLSWRAHLAGFSSVYSPASIAWHDFSLTPSSSALYYMERNRLVMILKTWKGLTMLLLLPGLLLAGAVDWGYMLMLGKHGLLARLRACSWSLVHLPEVWRLRRQVQRMRTQPDWVLLQSCAERLSPVLKTGGWAGRALIALCNIGFSINYKLTLSFLRKLNY